LLAEGHFTLDIPSRPMPTFNSRLSLGLPIRQTFQVENPPAAILWALKQLTLYRIQEKAQEDIAAGEVSSANRRLKHLASHLLAQGESSLARTVFEEIENLERDQSLTETGGKRIKYGTRALFQSNHT
jgi:Ca-activated chloride channel family protein